MNTLDDNEKLKFDCFKKTVKYQDYVFQKQDQIVGKSNYNI